MKSATSVLQNNNITLTDPSKAAAKDTKIFIQTMETGRKVEVDSQTVQNLMINKKQKKTQLNDKKSATNDPNEKENVKRELNKIQKFETITSDHVGNNLVLVTRDIDTLPSGDEHNFEKK